MSASVESPTSAGAAASEKPPASTVAARLPTAATGPAEGSGLRLQTGLLFFFSAIGFLIGRRTLGDNSFFTHFATGQLILETGRVPTADPYSFTAAGEPWVVQSWLASLIYGGLDAATGGFGIRIFNGVLTSVTAALVWRITSRRNDTVFIPLALSGLVLITGATMWSARPLLFGLVGFVLVLSVVDGLFKPIWLLPVMWVWVNSHGSFPLAGVLVGTIGVGDWIDRREFPIDTARILGWVTAGTLLGAINPIGPKLLWFPVQLLRRGEALENVVEWRPFQLSGMNAWIFALTVVVFIVSVVQKVEWRAVVPGVVFTLAAFMAVRNITVASIVLATSAAPNLRLGFGQLKLSDRGSISRILGAGSFCLLLLAVVSTFTAPIDLQGYPVEELRALDDEGLLDGEHRIIHTEIVGNYLGLWKGSAANVFVDDRFDFYPQQVLDDFDIMLYGGDYQSVIDRYEPDAILWKSGGGFEAWLQVRPDWVVAEPLAIENETTGETEPSEWFIARPSTATPSPEALASNP